MSFNSKTEVALAETMASFFDDPLGFVMAAYPWGEPTTWDGLPNPLREKRGPEPWQKKLLVKLGAHIKENGELTSVGLDKFVWRSAVASGHGVGKAGRLDAQVCTPFGVREWGSLTEGDMLFGEHGEWVTIRATRRYDSVPMRRVWFDDGSYSDVSTGHLWKVRGRQERRRGLDSWRVMSVADIELAGVKRKNGVAEARQWEIPRQGAVDIVGPDVAIDPYVLGVWLGDGSINSGRITTPDADIIERIKVRGYDVQYRKYDDRNCYTVGVHKLMNQLAAIGLAGKRAWEKSVPYDCKMQDEVFRLDVLRGLMDTDGTVGKNNGTATFTSTSKQLVEDVIWLARSLGGKAQMQDAVKIGKYKDADGYDVYCRDAYNCTIRMPEGYEPFYLERQLRRLGPCEARYLTRWIDRIEELPDAPAMCVEVDGGLYQANDFIVTHNSALVAWIIQFMMCTRVNTRGIVTANTQKQLEDKTWPELSKWHNLLICKHWFVWSATSYYFSKYADDRRKNYMVTAMTVSEENTEAFAGLHNEEGTVFVIFDEASGIAPKVWEVADGATTDGEGFFLAFGNPTRPDGAFFDCFTKHEEMFYLDHVDSREVSHTNKQALNDIIKKHGEDSDAAKVRVYGQFPSQGDTGFISAASVDAAMMREMKDPDDGEALIMAVDVARMGADTSIVYFRQGRDARSRKLLKFYKKDGWDLAGEIAAIYRKYMPDALVIDASGVGSGPVDILRKFYKIPVKELHTGVPARGSSYYSNMRAELWGKMRDAMHEMYLPDDMQLRSQLLAVQYFLVGGEGKIQLESKEKLKDRLNFSPDIADALAYTFAVNLPRRDVRNTRLTQIMGGSRNDAITDYDPIAY